MKGLQTIHQRYCPFFWQQPKYLVYGFHSWIYWWCAITARCHLSLASVWSWSKKADAILGYVLFIMKTPSFSVNDDEGYYHCFGCGAGGDAITFMRNRGVDFTEAVKQLAESGVPIPEQAETLSNYKNANSHGCPWRRRSLFTKANWHRRRMPPQPISMIEAKRGHQSRFQMGFALKRAARLYEPAGFDEIWSKQAYVFVRENNGLYDYFCNRIMFRFAIVKAVIAFGARAMGDAMPKYLNSKDGPTFRKSCALWLATSTRKSRRNLPLLVVEGYMDVIAVTLPMSQGLWRLWNSHDRGTNCLTGNYMMSPYYVLMAIKQDKQQLCVLSNASACSRTW